MTALLAFGALWLACAGGLAWLYVTAPWGRETETGFRYGEED